MSAAATVYALLIEDQRMDVTDDRRIATRWAATHGLFALGLHGAGASRAEIAAAARTRMLDGLQPEIDLAAVEAGIAAEDLRTWLREAGSEAIPAMPFIGQLEQIFVHRFKNADERWERNDLNDMVFLACAAGYADVVVGERKMSSYLNRADKAVTPRAFVCRTLEEAVEFLAD